MSVHPLVTGLRFARSELVRCLEGVSAEDAQRRPLPMNCLSWMVGHMANHEHRCWVMAAQGRTLVPGLDELVGYGKPASTPGDLHRIARFRMNGPQMPGLGSIVITEQRSRPQTLATFG